MNTDNTEHKLIKGLPSKDCVLPVQVGARPERDEANRKKASLKTYTYTIVMHIKLKGNEKRSTQASHIEFFSIT